MDDASDESSSYGLRIARGIPSETLTWSNEPRRWVARLLGRRPVVRHDEWNEFGRRAEQQSRQLRPVSRMQQMVIASARLSTARYRILGLLLGAANPESSGGHAVLKPLWANEAMHRAYQMVRLTQLLDGRMPLNSSSPIVGELEQRNAASLADALLSLRIVRDGEIVACSEAMRDVARNSVELFGPIAGGVVVKTDIERLELASYKRRALVLLAGHLVIDAISHSALNQGGGYILVQVNRLGTSVGRLVVQFGGHPLPLEMSDQSCGVIDDLCNLVEAKMMRRAIDENRTIAEIEFPT